MIRKFFLPGEETPGSEALTQGVRIRVRPVYVPEQSNPMDGLWLFSCRIQITNESMDTVQLLSRHWFIRDAHGETEEIAGLGIGGEQPVLTPGATFEYQSICPLPTPFGTMWGSYRMKTSAGDFVDLKIAVFELSQPLAIH